MPKFRFVTQATVFYEDIVEAPDQETASLKFAASDDKFYDILDFDVVDVVDITPLGEGDQ